MNVNFFENLIEQKLLGTSTMYLAKVISHAVYDNKCKIQPLSLIKAYGQTAKKQAILENVPISQTVLHTINANEPYSAKSLKDKVAIVMCAERDITQTRKGIFALPSLRRHSKSDSIVIGYL